MEGGHRKNICEIDDVTLAGSHKPPKPINMVGYIRSGNYGRRS